MSPTAFGKIVEGTLIGSNLGLGPSPAIRHTGFVFDAGIRDAEEKSRNWRI